MNDVPKNSSCLVSTDGTPVPLLGVALSGSVFGAHARLVLRQRYKNQESRPIEAIYTFPLPSDASVVGFAMEADGRRLEGEVKEREAAFQAYDDAIAKGHGAALLDQERRNVFTASVGNLLPGEETVIEVAYVQALTADEGALRLSVPTLVAPRYIPGAAAGDRTGHGSASPTDQVPDADRISPKIGSVAYGLAMDVVFDLGREVSIESPSHAVVVTKELGNKQRVTFGASEAKLDRDLILLASGAPGNAIGVVTEKAKGQDGTFALTVVPDLFSGKKVEAKHDVVFVIDVSGSMGGLSIEQATSALRLCLRHLAEGDRFDVIAFNTGFTPFASKLVPFTEKTLAEADQWVGQLHANGGTEMLQPLLAAVREAPAAKGRDRIVVLLTDGEVGNEAEIVKQVVAAADGVRFYTFGIGTNVSDLILSDLAKRTHGAMELIYPGERIDAKVTAQFARALAQRVTDVELRFEGVDAGELSPAELPHLVDGEPWVVYGRYSEPGIGRATLRGVLRGERFAMDVTVDLTGESTREGLAAMWATRRVRDLEIEGEKLDGRRATANVQRIVALSVEYKVASKHASFVVVEKRTGDRRATGLPEARPVPVNAPFGWADSHVTVDRLQSPGFGSATRAGGIMPQAIGTGGSRPMSPPSFGAPPPPPGFGPPPPMPQRPAAAMPPPMSRSAPAPAPHSPAPAMGMAPPIPGSPRQDGGAPHGAQEARGKMIAATPKLAGPMLKKESSEKAKGGGDPIRELFENQLWNGLFEDGDATDAGRLLATARALAMAFAKGVDSSHAVYGAQIKKAISAIEELTAKLAWTTELESAASAAIAAAVLVAASPRIKQRLFALVRGASAKVQQLESELQSEELAKKRLASLGISC